MNRKLAKRFPQYMYLNLDEEKMSYVMNQVSDVKHDSELDAVLKEIFSVDEVSGFPKGDIQYFLSKDGNPQVKAWLEANLLSPRAKQQGADESQISDDLIVEMSRRDGETSDDYRSRLMSIYDEAKSNYDSLLAQQQKTE